MRYTAVHADTYIDIFAVSDDTNAATMFADANAVYADTEADTDAYAGGGDDGEKEEE